MKSQRFDDIGRTLASGSSRRRFLAVLASGLVAEMPLSDRDAAARRKRRNKRKKRAASQCATGTKPCGEQCIPATNCCMDADCPTGTNQTCQGGVCACPPGQEDSGGVCGTEPTCTEFFQPCTVNGDCCSNFCTFLGASFVCGCCGGQGSPCHASIECGSGLTCAGFVCRA
jgi:hypothetical protein